jgi:glycosyltransferase involved in cell wall biosynthesis
MENLVSIIIPSRNEIFLQKTILDILSKAKGEIEVIVVLDGYWPTPQKTEFWLTPAIVEDPRISYIHLPAAMGMRNAINTGVAVAKGEYLLKCDAHCMFDEGFDIVLAADCDKNWVVVPRRKRLDVEKWQLETGKPDVDYEYLSYPGSRGNWAEGLHGRVWDARAKERADVLIDDNMSAQGSCWLMRRDYFYELELEDDKNYGTFNHEFQEIGLKAWLSGGRVITNKKTWYAHFHKNKETGGRGYHLPGQELEKGTAYTNKWLTNSAWAKQTLPFEWIIEKFWPVPTWPENWKEVAYP